MVYQRDDVVGIDASIIMNPKVWDASGHTDAFTDPLRECKKCHHRFRTDHVKEKCPDCDGELSGVKKFNLLTEVLLGATEPKQSAYLRGEITQGVFVNFKNVVDSTRVKIPFGIAQIGKAFRNEITPGNLNFRSREFEQMELEYFIEPNEKNAKKIFDKFMKMRMAWYTDLGMDKEMLRFRDHKEDEKAHYAKAATDIEYKAPFGWSEFEGIHNRGDWDLGRHNLKYKDDAGNEYTPWVIETSGGIDRAALFFLLDAYKEKNKRKYLKLDKRLAPFKLAVFPLLGNKKDLIEKARVIFDKLRLSLHSAWDDRGNIGKRYLAQDEIGTPNCITIDFDTLKDDSVTVRDRDTTKQVRVSVDKLPHYLNN